MKVLRILVACEESQAVCKAFRALGHKAFSCDLQDCSGGHPEWHIKGDVLKVLNLPIWDLIIAHPPCTHLAVSGARHFENKRKDGRQAEAIEFFCKILNANCEKIVVENPVGIISGDYIPKYFPDLAKKYNLPIKHTQIIQPYEYGDASRKTTCLWIKGLNPLKPTNIVEPDIISYTCKNCKKVTFSRDYCQGVSKNRGVKRSKTYPGIAKAMAEQWSEYILKEIEE